MRPMSCFVFLSNRLEKAIVDTGTSAAIIPNMVTIRNKVNKTASDNDEPDYEGITVMKLGVIGQAEFFVKLNSIRHT